MKYLKNTFNTIEKYSTDHPNIFLGVAALLYIATIVAALAYANRLVFDFLPNAEIFKTRGVLTLKESLIRYDTVHYINIARDGYSTATTAFFPLYLMLIRLVNSVSGLSYQWASLAVGWSALVAAVIVLYKWAKLELNERKIKIPAMELLGLLAIFPTAFYFALGYTESLFLFLSVWSIYLYKKDSYLAAGLVAGLATATRVHGLILLAYFAADIFFSGKIRQWRNYIPIIIGSSGIIFYMAFLWNKFGTPFQFILAQREWGRLSGNFIANFISTATPVDVWYIAVYVFGLIGVWKYLNKPYFIYCLLFGLLSLFSGRVDSFGRYMIIIAPLFLGLILLAHKEAPKQVRLLYIVSSAFLLGWSILLFANGYWVA
ncbi:hypothetical protein DYH10_00570 [Candidatus Saccharibacteria bacterium CPR2]|nr:hypothetical protein [Candidatus Saccharibacteria bacterium CPR2]